MGQQSKLIQAIAFDIMSSAIALIAVEIIPASQASTQQIPHPNQCGHTYRRATAATAAKFGKAIWKQSTNR